MDFVARAVQVEIQEFPRAYPTGSDSGSGPDPGHAAHRDPAGAANAAVWRPHTPDCPVGQVFGSLAGTCLIQSVPMIVPTRRFMSQTRQVQTTARPRSLDRVRASGTSEVSLISDVFRSPSKLAKHWVRGQISRRGYEILADPFDQRLAKMLDHFGVETVIDGGANIGQFGHALRKAGFKGRIFSAEPLSSAFAQLVGASGNDPLWVAERVAFSDQEGLIEMNIAANSVSSSALPMLKAHADADPRSVYVGKESAPSTTLDAFVDRHGIDPSVTMLKLDVQGYEGTALAGATESIGKFRAAQMELSYVPLYGGQWLAGDVTEFLVQHGYELWMFDSAAMYEPDSKRLLQCDGIFVRT